MKQTVEAKALSSSLRLYITSTLTLESLPTALSMY